MKRLYFTVITPRQPLERKQVATPVTASPRRADGQTARARRQKGGPQRSLPLRQRQEVQKLLRGEHLRPTTQFQNRKGVNLVIEMEGFKQDLNAIRKLIAEAGDSL